MSRGFLAFLCAVALLFTSGCQSKSKDQTEAIRAGVMQYLASRNMFNMSNMEVKVASTTVSGNEAQARVEVHAKGTDPSSIMQIDYALEKQGNDWVVTKTSGMGGGLQHPAPGQGSPNGSLPAGHPNVNGSPTGQVPPDHPNFNAILNSGPNSNSPPQQGTPPAPPTTSSGKP
jgi:hypothetical protein